MAIEGRDLTALAFIATLADVVAHDNRVRTSVSQPSSNGTSSSI